MVFLPTVPPPREASARAQDLGRRLKAEVDKFEAQYPGTSKDDLRAAAAIAIGEDSARVPRRRRFAVIAASLIAGLVVAGVGVQAAGGGTGEGAGMSMVAIGAAAACAGVVAAVVRTRRR